MHTWYKNTSRDALKTDNTLEWKNSLTLSLFLTCTSISLSLSLFLSLSTFFLFLLFAFLIRAIHNDISRFSSLSLRNNRSIEGRKLINQRVCVFTLPLFSLSLFSFSLFSFSFLFLFLFSFFPLFFFLFSFQLRVCER